MSKFGWSYPAGAENDPFAPYNDTETEEPPSNEMLKKAFPYNGLYEIYRSYYKYTACGVTVGALVEYEEEIEDGFGSYAQTKQRWVYCDDLRDFGTWDDLNHLVLALSVSSIVEGVDETTETHEISTQQEPETLRKEFDAAVKQTEAEAEEIWNRTHGCDVCGEPDESGNRYVNPDCPECGGEGIVI